MISWIFQMTIVSIIFILIVHHLIIFFKDNLTVPKVKDLVNVPAQKYQAILDIISKKDNRKEYNYSEENLLPVDNRKIDTESMKNELKSFLKEQFNNKSTSLENLPSSNNLYKATDFQSPNNFQTNNNFNLPNNEFPSSFQTNTNNGDLYNQSSYSSNAYSSY